MNSSVEHVLEGGNVAEAVVRVGSTVRKPTTVSTAAVEALLDHFAEVGFSGAPLSLGRPYVSGSGEASGSEQIRRLM